MRKIYYLQAKSLKYDAYNSCVVCATSEDKAKLIHPNYDGEEANWKSDTWVYSPNDVIVTLLGNARKGLEVGLICSSYNAG